MISTLVTGVILGYCLIPFFLPTYRKEIAAIDKAQKALNDKIGY